MNNFLAMALYSRSRLTEKLAHDQIAALSTFEGGLFCPNKYNRYEPIRNSFSPADVSQAVNWLAETHGSFLYRTGRPAYSEGAMWNRTHRPEARFPSPLFSNYWTGAFRTNWALKVGLERIEAFVIEMFNVMGADYAYLTPESDKEAKNTDRTHLSMQGRELAEGIPGLYWFNLFSAELAGWLKLETVPENLVERRALTGGVTMLKFCASPEDCQTVDVLQRQRSIIELLGPDKFFDILYPDRTLTPPPWQPLA